ncbi:MAG TPA: FAD:protein FMN transferase [Phycisphaerales bacterium]|nr:FAD:protein FMN transferase [Phycisphaerales bacterium]HMP35910.1 FAD:protein FMN transferase [Phycisphaerales bacterium]
MTPASSARSGDGADGLPAGAAAFRFAAEAMGTRFEAVLGDDGRGEAAARSIAEEALHGIASLDLRLSRFRRDSLLAHLHRHAGSDPVELDAELFALFALAESVRCASDGLFDPDVGAAMERSGFHDRSANGARPARSSGSALENRDVGRAPPYTLDPATRTVTLRRGASLDFGGIAKGHALDLAAATLREHGVRCALLHGGRSAVVTIGAPPGRTGWRIELAPAGGSHSKERRGASARMRSRGAALAPSDRPVASAIDLRDRALAVSTPFGRVVGGRSHIVDPRRGRPAPIALLPAQVAIAGPLCALCDAWTKPALLLGSRPSGLDAAYECVLGWETAPAVREAL